MVVKWVDGEGSWMAEEILRVWQGVKICSSSERYKGPTGYEVTIGSEVP